MRQNLQRLTQIHLNNLIFCGHFVPLLVELFTHQARVQRPIAIDPHAQAQATTGLMAHILACDKRHTMGG